MSTVRISEENKELVEDVADQLGTTIKEVIDMILQWFFSQAGAGDLVDEDEEEEE